MELSQKFFQENAISISNETWGYSYGVMYLSTVTLHIAHIDGAEEVGFEPSH